MESRNFVWRQTAVILIGQIICSGAMVGIFALLGYYDLSVLLGGIIGSLVATGNFLAMAMVATVASDKAEQQDVEGGKKLLKASYPLRLIVLALILVAFAKSGLCNIIALALPLLFVRPILTVGEFFKKKEA
jgi:ABC-type nickel/cobalt efflux system permease component RcnA